MAGLMRKAQRRKAKLRLGMSGPAGSGKTFSSLLMAYGITEDWEKICLIDTENGSGDLYADYSQNGVEIGEYNIINLAAPYSPDKYVAAIKECEAEGIEVVIIDSLSHAWAGEGGLLDKKGQIEKRTGNGWTAWRDVTPLHNRLVETMLSSPCHIITTLRAKMDYVQEKNEQGKTVVRKIGMNPVQREGMEFEFTVFMDIDQDHQASASKDRTSLLDGKVFRPGIDTGRKLLAWLESGVDAPASSPPASKPSDLLPDGVDELFGNHEDDQQGETTTQLPEKADKARRAFFAKIGDVADRTGVDRGFAEEKAKAFLYHKFKISSLTQLTAAQWQAVGSQLDKVAEAVTKIIERAIAPAEEASA